MGQYFKPVNIDRKQYLLSHDYEGNGLKLMEHSYIDNHFVETVESLIAKGGQWYKDRIVWAGDYADNDFNESGEEKDFNLYGWVSLEDKINPPMVKKGLRYLVNLDTREFVDKTKIPGIKNMPEWQIHPLPLLTCEGNGRGGGDYKGESPLIGKWARQRVIASGSKPKNCTEIIFDLTED
jgi:hypothetical protein